MAAIFSHTATTLGQDFPVTPTQITIPAFSSPHFFIRSSPVQFGLLNDVKVEGSETFHLRLEATGLDNRVILTTEEPKATITDDDG